MLKILFWKKIISNRKKIKNSIEGESPIIVAPFDAELFGHWWYEGPLFLEYIFRNLAQLDNLESCTPSKVIDTIEKVQIVTPAESSWGEPMVIMMFG